VEFIFTYFMPPQGILM